MTIVDLKTRRALGDVELQMRDAAASFVTDADMEVFMEPYNPSKAAQRIADDILVDMRCLREIEAKDPGAIKTLKFKPGMFGKRGPIWFAGELTGFAQWLDRGIWK